MISLTLTFVDNDGFELPWQDGIQHVRQFNRPWRLRLSGDWQGKVILLGEPPLPLNPVNSPESTFREWELPSGSRRADEQAKAVASAAGLITATLADSSGLPIPDGPIASLYVSPASLSQAEMEQLLADIGLLAIAASSYSYRDLPSELGNGAGSTFGYPIASGSGITLTAERLLKLGETVRYYWDQIEKRPLKSIVMDMGQVSRHQLATKGPYLMKLKLQPERQSLIGQRSTETTDCLENRFLLYLFDNYLITAARMLAASIEWLAPREVHSLPLLSRGLEARRYSFIQKAKERIKKAKAQASLEKEHRAHLSTSLKALAAWAQSTRETSFLSQIEIPNDAPAPTLRLTGSATYGPIFEQYSNLSAGRLESLQKAIHLYDQITKQQVRSTWNLYEIWCVVRLYGAFVLDFDFSVPEGKQSLFDRIVLKSGILELPKNEVFHLYRTLKASKRWEEDKELHLEFCYEPECINQEGQPRRPDIKLTITTDWRSDTFYFDAKYRRYKNQGVETLIEDVVGVARNKYLAPLGARGSYILHSDRSLDYWGEIPLQRKLETAYEYEIDWEEYPGHRYGAISLKPDQGINSQITRLARMLFHYFGAYPTACLHCGKFLRDEEDIRANWDPSRITETELISRIVHGGGAIGQGAPAAYCSCPDCGDFWVVQRCYGEHHRLIKSWDQLHRKSDHSEYRGKWMYICPVCGSDPDPSEFW